jgi:PAS domain-containing protein
MPAKNRFDRVTGVVLSLLDVTDRVRAFEIAHRNEATFKRLNEELEACVAERTAALRQQLLKSAQRIARLGHWSVNVQTGKLHWSDETYRIFGQEMQSFGPSQDRFFEIVHPDDVDAIWRTQEEAFAQDSDTGPVSRRSIGRVFSCPLSGWVRNLLVWKAPASGLPFPDRLRSSWAASWI